LPKIGKKLIQENDFLNNLIFPAFGPQAVVEAPVKQFILRILREKTLSTEIKNPPPIPARGQCYEKIYRFFLL
jgi:hypothetical protein